MSGVGADPATSGAPAKWVVFVAPHTGGIYSFARKLAAVLGERLLTAELQGEAERWTGYDRSLAGPEHHVVPLDDAHHADGTDAARAIVRWIADHNIHIVLVTPMTPSPVFDALPHLPPHVRVISRLTEISAHSYRMALRHKGALDLLIVQAPRQQADLRSQLDGLPVALLPNGVDTDRFKLHRRKSSGPLRLLFLDRLVDEQKQVFALQPLCEALDATGIDWQLTVGGDGPDAHDLRASLDPWIARKAVEWLGHVSPEQVPALMGAQHLYLKFSRNEGSPNAVLEAMAAGLPTIAMKIDGVMDYVIADGETGWIVPQGDITGIASRIAALDADRKAITTARQAARKRAIKTFSLASFAKRVAQIEAELPAVSARPQRDWSHFRPSEKPAGALKRLTKRLLPLRWRAAMRAAIGR